ncbi:nuclear phosphoprotein [Psittacid alphaherpesvirus 1]|uniref:Nuclear egress protein 1 n=1 Tax=Psittacid herpesvirus 1 (isolate Amazon parrot/-/97-0001/1997) TaxID=670426 RepID=NEC1_PSHV1|nr:nuclear egress lamina protein [Psittacid alphaherpesvirus 1]Q6UDK0.1 RecName: Full=Nuclear egress protein 1 [Psittacid herpesvirus 1 Amazon parrot/1997]AAQ73710.1 nuclear phosphoprotein [Psittacid alphaherpesvirus 1]
MSDVALKRNSSFFRAKARLTLLKRRDGGVISRSLEHRRSSRRRSSVSAPTRRVSGTLAKLGADDRRQFFDAFFRMTAVSPEETVSLLRSMTVPVIQQENISLPYDINAKFAPGDCISLSEMGYTLEMGGCCSLCSYGWSTTTPPELPALELAFMHHLSSVVEFKELVTSLRVCAGNSIVGNGAYENEGLLRMIKHLLEQSTLFYAYYTVKGGVSHDFRVLISEDGGGDGGSPAYAMYFVFKPGSPLHLGAKLIRQLIFNCPGYKWHADVHEGAFLLVVTRDRCSAIPEPRRVKLDPEDVYRRYCDVLVTEEKVHDYSRLYSTFSTYCPPASRREQTAAPATAKQV